MVYIGVDLHRKKSQVAAIDQDGKLVLNRKVRSAAPPEVREVRRLVRMRASLVRLRAKLKAQVHALLGEHGIQLDVVDLFSKKGREMLRPLQLPAISRSRLETCLRLIDEISLEIVIAEREIYQTVKDDERVKRLLPIPGIGPIIAATILSEIGDITRFSSPDKLCSWAGLTPKEHSSADNVRRGHISKQGSRWLRWVMVEAAVHAFRDVELRQLFVRIAGRRGPKIARVAVARRLLHPGLLRPPQRDRLPELSDLFESKGRGAFDGCHGLSLRRPAI